jgi:triosephosphate isomerase
MPTPFAIANWKMNLPPEGVQAYLDAVRGQWGASTLVVAPPFPYLGIAVASGVEVAAQTCAQQASGAFTGEVSASMVRESGARYVIVGHSERRKLFGETDAVVAAKLEQALGAGLTPVLCVGEDEATFDAGDSKAFVAAQLEAVAGALGGAKDVILAYEPIWAIGTGRNAEAKSVAETVAHIVATLARSWPKTLAGAVPVLYGGSVTPENAKDLANGGGIDGFLVGGASLVSAKFLAIKSALDRAAESGNNSPPWQV